MLTQENLASYLTTPFRFYPSVDSTNDIARDWLLNGAPDGAVVIADEQRKGRGRMGRVWHTPPGVALAISIILRPQTTTIAPLTMLGAVAIAELCESLGASDVAIKWPNDVQIQGRKVSGILPEAVWQDNQLTGVVLGMGINLTLDFDDTLRATAINLAEAVPSLPSRPQLIAQLLYRIHHWSASRASDELFQAWQRRLNTIAQRVQIADVQGVAESVTPDGELIVRDDAQRQHRIIAGELHYLTQTIED